MVLLPCNWERSYRKTEYLMTSSLRKETKKMRILEIKA